MSYQFKQIRLDKLNIPAETLLKASFPANNRKLKASIETYGVIVPLIVTELGKGEYADGMVRDEQRLLQTVISLPVQASVKIILSQAIVLSKYTDKLVEEFRRVVNQLKTK